VVAAESAPKEMGLGSPNEIQYIINDTSCGSAKRKHTVRSWLEEFGISSDDQFFIKWNDTVFKLISVIQRYEGTDGVTDKAMDMMWSGIFQSLYTDYDINQDFQPQFEVNIAKILGVFDKLSHAF